MHRYHLIVLPVLAAVYVNVTSCGSSPAAPTTLAAATTATNPPSPANTPTPAGTTSTKTPPAPPPTPISVTIYTSPNNMVSPLPLAGYTGVTVPLIPGPSDGNCNLGCGTPNASDVLVTVGGFGVLGFISVPGVYAGTQCLPVDSNNLAGLCALDYAKCGGNICTPVVVTGDAFERTTDPNQAANPAAANDYRGVPGCNIGCYFNVVKDGNSTGLTGGTQVYTDPNTTINRIGLIRVPGVYVGDECEPTPYGAGDISAVQALKNMCADDYSTVCGDNFCWAGGDTGSLYTPTP